MREKGSREILVKFDLTRQCGGGAIFKHCSIYLLCIYLFTLLN